MLNISKISKAVVVLSMLVVFCVACGTEDPDFVSSGCKQDAEAQSIMPLLDVWSDDDIDLSGLECVVYKLDEDSTLDLKLVNVWSGCSDGYNGFVRENSNSAALVELERADCSASAGCMCLYDYTLSLSDVDGNTDFEFAYRDLACGGDSRVCTQTAILPLADSKTGIVCNYLIFDDFYEHYMECDPNVAADAHETEKCSTGKVCTSTPTSNGTKNVCLTPCTDQNECAAPFECAEGSCRLPSIISQKCE